MHIQVGGAHDGLLQHIQAVQRHPLLGHDIDFKLSRSQGPLNEQSTKESGFAALQVTLCKVRRLCSMWIAQLALHRNL